LVYTFIFVSGAPVSVEIKKTEPSPDSVPPKPEAAEIMTVDLD